MLANMTSAEITAWQEFLKVRAERMDEARKQAAYDKQFE